MGGKKYNISLWNVTESRSTKWKLELYLKDANSLIIKFRSYRSCGRCTTLLTARAAMQTKAAIYWIKVTVYFWVARLDRLGGAAMEKAEEHWTPLNWGQCMTCHISVRRLTAALHNPQGHSHHKLYVSETGPALCWWCSLTDIYWCEQRRFLIHKMCVAHIIKNGRGLVG